MTRARVAAIAFLGLCIGTSSYVAALFAQQQAVPQRPAQQSSGLTTVGRFQVISTTNGLYPVILLDTVSGATWTTCLGDEVDGQRVKEWCKVERVDARAASNSAPQAPRPPQ